MFAVFLGGKEQLSRCILERHLEAREEFFTVEVKTSKCAASASAVR